jgi:hypothetical protein
MKPLGGDYPITADLLLLMCQGESDRHLLPADYKETNKENASIFIEGICK